jgi:RNA polymerase sigma factor (sigma-70 family)
MEPSDETLVLACRRGDESAWEILITRYQRLIYTIPIRAGLDEQLCADVFQRVFTTLIEKLNQIEQPSRIGAWLVTTARRETWRVSRRERNSGVSLNQADDDENTLVGELADGDPLPEDVVVNLETQHAVRMAVDDLDERCRTLLTMLFYRSDVPAYSDIAAALGTSEGSIGPTRARCLQKLRRSLERLGVALSCVVGPGGLFAEFGLEFTTFFTRFGL